MDILPDRAAWLKGPAFLCDRTPGNPLRPLRALLLGPPGVGKGTQAAMLARSRGACHLSTGDVFRVAATIDASKRSPVLRRAIEMMTHGELVTDDTVVQLVRERIGCLRCPGGFLLDGFPRTVPQARALDDMLARAHIPLDVVIAFGIPESRLIARLAGRRSCIGCRAVYHLQARPPARPGTCDICGQPLQQRADDTPDAIRVRLATYSESTAPLLDYYKVQQLVLPVSADGNATEVFQRASASLDAKLAER